MALKGNLRDFSITQLLNLVNVAQKTGTLVVERELQREREQIYISFREGKLSFAHNAAGPASLTTVLYHAKKLNAAQVRAINDRSIGMTDKELGLLLINSNYLSQQDILGSLQAYYLNLVSRLFIWNEGLFYFDNNLLPPKDKITVRISLENLIIEGSRRMREWEQLQGEIPSLEMALKFSQRPGINLRNLNLSTDEWKVISFVNPKNTINQIAKATNKNDLEIRRIVYSFLQAGLVDMVRPEGMPLRQPVPPPPYVQAPQYAQPFPPIQHVEPSQPVQTARPAPVAQPEYAAQPVSAEQAIRQAQSVPPDQLKITLPSGTKTEFRSLINRIINRIRSI